MNRKRARLILIGAICCMAAAPCCSEPIPGAQEVLTALGALSGAQLYTSYVSLGSVIDGWIREVYPPEQVVSLVGVLRTLMQRSAESLDAVAALGLLADEDQSYLAALVGAYALLEEQARSFLAWAESGDSSGYEEKRKAAREMVAAALGLGGEAGE